LCFVFFFCVVWWSGRPLSLVFFGVIGWRFFSLFRVVFVLRHGWCGWVLFSVCLFCWGSGDPLFLICCWGWVWCVFCLVVGVLCFWVVCFWFFWRGFFFVWGVCFFVFFFLFLCVSFFGSGAFFFLGLLGEFVFLVLEVFAHFSVAQRHFFSPLQCAAGRRQSLLLRR